MRNIQEGNASMKKEREIAERTFRKWKLLKLRNICDCENKIQ